MEEKQTSSFAWDFEKELGNIYKHGVDFITAAKAFNPDFAIAKSARRTA